VRPWLLGIARHVAIDVRRRRRRERPMDGPADADEETESWVDRIVDPSPGPDDHAATREQARRVQTALGALATQQREALILFHVEGEDYQRISARLGVPMGTVATWLSRGRKALVEALGAPSTSAVSASKPAARET
jgi:RNA polymerase sigma-70 factor (ECF subfamily)